jgi:hypothetical protein
VDELVGLIEEANGEGVARNSEVRLSEKRAENKKRLRSEVS